MYDAWLALHAEDRALIRLQINFLHNQGFIPALGDLDHQLPELRERLKNQFPFFGDDMVRTGAIGEWAAPFAAPTNVDNHAVWYEAQRLVAKARWRNENAQAGSPTSSAPFSLIEPVRRPTMPMIERIVVVLPAPLRPSRHSTSPGARSSDTPRSTCTWP